jgi:DnaJ-class molecular chaperone
MDQMQALAILGLESHATKDEIIAAHRRLIQKMHPDHGGSTYLAARINEAKTLLVKSRKSK